MSTIMSQAKELADSIVSSTEFEEMKEKEAAMVANEEAKSMLDELNAKYKQLQMLQQNGQQVTEEQKQELNAMEQKMRQNDLINDFFEKQQKFNQLMQSVNQVITSEIQNYSTESNE